MLLLLFHSKKNLNNRMYYNIDKDYYNDKEHWHKYSDFSEKNV